LVPAPGERLFLTQYHRWPSLFCRPENPSRIGVSLQHMGVHLCPGSQNPALSVFVTFDHLQLDCGVSCPPPFFFLSPSISVPGSCFSCPLSGFFSLPFFPFHCRTCPSRWPGDRSGPPTGLPRLHFSIQEPYSWFSHPPFCTASAIPPSFCSLYPLFPFGRNKDLKHCILSTADLPRVLQCILVSTAFHFPPFYFFFLSLTIPRFGFFFCFFCFLSSFFHFPFLALSYSGPSTVFLFALYLIVITIMGFCFLLSPTF